MSVSLPQKRNNLPNIRYRMHRIHLHEHDPLFLIDNHVRPLGEPVPIPEEPILFRNGSVRPEIAEERRLGDPEVLCPCLLAGYGVHANPDGDAVVCGKHLALILKRFHLGCTELRPCERVEREEYAFPFLLIEIEGLVVLVLEREVPRRLACLYDNCLYHRSPVLVFWRPEGMRVWI